VKGESNVREGKLIVVIIRGFYYSHSPTWRVTSVISIASSTIGSTAELIYRTPPKIKEMKEIEESSGVNR